MRRTIQKQWGILAGVLGSIVIIGFLWVVVLSLRGTPTQQPISTAVMTIIPPPTQTSVFVQPTAAATTTSTPNYIPPPNSAIAVDSHVQVTGTLGDGLRLRTEPSTTAEIRFLGMDSEVFQVKDGPVEADGFTWWYLVAPVDATRGGWAVSNYLAVIQVP